MRRSSFASWAPLALLALLGSCSRSQRASDADPSDGAPSAHASDGARPPVNGTNARIDAASTFVHPPIDGGSKANASSSTPAWVCGQQLFEGDFRGTDVVNPRTKKQTKAANRVDLLGKTLPPFITRSSAIAWTEHPHPETVDQVTARKWPGATERWVITVTGKAAKSEGASLFDVRLAVVEVTREAGISVQRVARSRAPFVAHPDWGALPQSLQPQFACGPDDCADDTSPAGFDDATSLFGLDFAHYDLSSQERAFGVNLRTNEGYAGGGASFDTLTLFRIVGEDLVAVLSVPMSVQKLLAGDWNEDGTRNHESVEGELVVEVKPVDGKMAQLLWHSDFSRHAITYTWNEEHGQYGCAAP